MGESLVVGLLDIVAKEAGEAALQRLRLMRGMEKAREKLQDSLAAIQAVLAHAEEMAATNPAVKVWFDRLKAVAYAADDVLDEFRYEELRQEAKMHGHIVQNVTSFFSPKNPIFFRCRMSSELNAIVERIDELIAQIDKFKFVKHQVVRTKQLPTYAYIDGSDIVGRVEEKQKIVTWLINRCPMENIAVLPIVGIGGLGKTTLAQMVYNDNMVKQHFQLLLWVHVSDNFDVAHLAKAIIDLVIQGNCDLPKDNIELLQQRLRNELSGQRYLLILDDVWNEDADKWAQLKALLGSGRAGSTILVTTRSEKVALIMGGSLTMHHLAPLSCDDLWTIFQTRAFSLEVQHRSELVEIGKKIVKKCMGSPLVAKALGSLMSDKRDVQEWMAILEQSRIWDDKDEIPAALSLSYDHLPPNMKLCFTFCVVFPKDHEIDVDMLIQLWIANGFIPYSGMTSLEEKGQGIFRELAWRSFFQDVIPKKMNESIHGYCGTMKCKMHDLMHELAQSIMGSECVNILDKEQFNASLENIRHLSIHDYLAGNIPVKSFSSLRTLMCHKWQTPGFIDLSKFESLRVLDLHRSMLKISIKPGHLKHLRYLDLSEYRDVEALPEAICTLFNLRTLKLSNCRKLCQLPKGMGYMRSLQHVYLDGCDSLECMPSGLEKLNSLCTLTTYVVGSNPRCGNIREIKNLNLGGQLHLKHLENLGDGEDAREASLFLKKSLNCLKLSWCEDSSQNHEEVLEALKPHNGLQMLQLEGYEGINFSRWMRNARWLPSLIELHLDGCTECADLPQVCKLSHLRVLHLQRMNNVQYICSGNETSHAFPALKEIVLHGMVSLKGWQVAEGNEAAPLAFPQLEKMKIEYCPMLETIPEAPLLRDLKLKGDTKLNIDLLVTAYLTSLSTLEIEVYGDGPSWRNWHLSQSYEQNLALRSGNQNNRPHSSLLRKTAHLTSLSTLEIEVYGDGSSWRNWHLSRPYEQNLALLLDNQNNRSCSSSLREMVLHGCHFFFIRPQLQSTLWLWKHFVFLEDLTIHNCHVISFWPVEEFQCLTSLKYLKIKTCLSLMGLSRKRLPSTSSGKQLLPRLEFLDIDACTSLEVIFNLSSSLRRLYLYHCPDLRSLSGHLNSLEQLYIGQCSKLMSIWSCLGNLPSLKSLKISYCQSPTSLPDGMDRLAALQLLTIECCPGMESLPECLRQQIDGLQGLWIWGCPNLERHCRQGGEYWDMVSHVPEVQIGRQRFQEGHLIKEL